MSIFKDDKGKHSFIRVIGFMGFIIGVILVIFGLIGWFTKLENAVTIITVAVGLITAIIGLKAWQKTSE